MDTTLPPGPRDRFFGLKLLREMQRNFFPFWEKTHKTYGDTVHIKFANMHSYAFAHPEHIRSILVDKAKSFIRYPRHMSVLAQLHGQSVLITEGETWQKQRRTLQPGFSPKRFDSYAQQVVDAAGSALDALPADGRTPFDFEHAMNMLTIDVVLRTMFGSRVEQDTSEIEKAIRTLSSMAYDLMFRRFDLPDWLPLPSKRTKRRYTKLLDDMIWSHIHRRRAQAQSGQDLLGMLLTAVDEEGDGDALSDVQVRDQCMTMFLAGHETTASGLTWLGWVLAAYPEVAARATEEVDRVLGNRTPTYADLGDLVYIAQVIKETLRLYSPAPGVFMRYAIEDVQIGEWTIPKGAMVQILSAITHRDSRWFAEPERFDPDRFDSESAREIPRGAYFPFGTGPRVCIGNSFATMEMTLVAAMLLQRYRLKPADSQHEPERSLQVTMRPAGGVQLVLEKRLPDVTRMRQLDEKSANSTAAAKCPYHTSGSLV